MDGKDNRKSLNISSTSYTYDNCEYLAQGRRTLATMNQAELKGISQPSGRATELGRVNSFSSTGSGFRYTEMRLIAAPPEENARPERKNDYRGRYRTWPGIVLFLGLLGLACGLIVLGAFKTYDQNVTTAEEFEKLKQNKRKIKDGLNGTDDLIADDGEIGNPKEYPSMGCELPNYVSKDRQLWAISKNGTEVPVAVKGVNWFGMETGLAIPFGLWENFENGTTAYEIASFLARNKFNSIRLPVCIKHILEDTPPEPSLVNLHANRALNISTYMSTIQSLVESLAYRHITVMISLHTLDPKGNGGAWYNAELDVSEDDFLEAVDKLTKNLCSSKYWNILGLDLKNEPHKCSWGGEDPDWQKGSSIIGNRMLEGCPNWLAFVEGVNGGFPANINGKERVYFDWWGGGLEGAGKNPTKLNMENKVVWAPHYYNPAVDPAWYLYKSGDTQSDRSIKGYEELPDNDLKANVHQTMDLMFGYLRQESGYAIVLGEFAGLYATDKHPMKTTQRTTDFNIEILIEDEYAGGYMWSLNPESAYQFNPGDEFGHYTEGLLLDDWLSPNIGFLEGMAKLDQLKNLRPFPCFPEEIESE